LELDLNCSSKPAGALLGRDKRSDGIEKYSKSSRPIPANSCTNWFIILHPRSLANPAAVPCEPRSRHIKTCGHSNLAVQRVKAPSWPAIEVAVQHPRIESTGPPRAKRTNFLACLLSNDFVRILVFPNSEKDRMPETIISGPLFEFHLADHRRFNPPAAPHFGSSQTLVQATPTSSRKLIKGHFSMPMKQECGENCQNSSVLPTGLNA
jgi:hypothetical protein